MIQRYDTGRGQDYECTSGRYVLHSDYAALEARHAALREAEKTISECLQECAYVAGVKAGWNAALINDDAEARQKYQRLVADTDRRLAQLKAARAEVDRLMGEG